jgi:OPT family oligopeptide transporter
MPYANIPNYWGTGWISVGGYSLMQLTVAFEGSFLYIAFGALIGLRQAVSLLLGALVNYVILAPIMLNNHVIARASYPAIVSWSLWIGVPMLITSSLVVLCLQWRTTLRAFSSIVASLRGRSPGADDPMEQIEVPGSWFAIGFLACSVLTIWLGAALFHIAWWMGVIAVLSCFFLVIVAARATGETGQTPQGSISKITQFTFGAIDPTRTATNLMTANITAGATVHASDLLGDLKSGYLLGANPRQQFLAQVIGVLAGGLVVVPVFYLLIPDASLLGTARWPAPGAIVWKGVAELVTHGFGALDPTARLGFAIGAIVGIVLPLLEVALPKHRQYIPSATGIGVAFTIPAFACISMFIGALAALWFGRIRPKLAEEFTVPIASGLIVGESLMGVLIALLIIKGWLS